MKQWQVNRLHALLNFALYLNRHAWVALAAGAFFVALGVFFESVASMWAGAILIGACVFLDMGTTGITTYVRRKKKQWK
jgi:Zn-dependent membrane protease YugP